ncbi:putative Dihydroflavonol-4-reductase [Candidatus Zixiibacteriota bacterium]|nr:putative Dihydroflavonol-4-reductase [candidate division Zixibacteria bacterium]
MHKKNILVTGANGHLGRRIVERLPERGYNIIAHYRSPSKVEEFCPPGVRAVVGDINDSSWMSDAFKDIDCVIHTAAKVSLRAGQDEEMYRVNVEGTKNLLRAARASGVKRFIHFSSVAAVGGSIGTELLTESAEFNFNGIRLPYFRTKYEAEQFVLQANNGSFAAVVLNPSIIIFPPERPVTEKKIAPLRRRVPVYFDFGLNLVHADDVVEAAINAIEMGRGGERYILAGENTTPKMAIKLTRKYFGMKKPLIKLPIFSLYPIFALYEIYYNVFNRDGKGARLNRGLARLAKMRFFYSSNKAIRELNFRPRTLEQMIRNILTL